MTVSTTFDLLLRGGRVIDPASGVDGFKDLAIRNDKIAAVRSDILPTTAREITDVTGKIVLVDQGGPSCMTLPGFQDFIAEQAKSRTYDAVAPILPQAVAA
jgi:dihydroorotase